jgi:chemotaxis protein MotB
MNANNNEQHQIFQKQQKHGKHGGHGSHKGQDNHDNHERWLISYADFITLLFAFFVVMYATSTNNIEKQKSFENSVRVNLNLGASGTGHDSRTDSLKEAVSELARPIEGFPKSQDPKELEEYIEKELDQKLAPAMKNQAIASIRHDLLGLRITLAASAFFPVGSAKLIKEALPALDRVADILKQTSRRIVIEGHTDDQPFLGPNGETNWELASNRATSVVRYLIKVHRLSPKRMTAISYADQKPLIENTDQESRAKNRRIELLLVNEGG